MSGYHIRPAERTDETGIRELLPRLADFPVPAYRDPEDLWRSDEALLLKWLDGGAPECFAHVAAAADGNLLGVTLVSMRPEMLSGEPSAHLEAIVVAKPAEGRGIGRDLLGNAELEAQQRGARSMTLHVFASNVRARRVYESTGYQGELIRHIKLFDSS